MEREYRRYRQGYRMRRYLTGEQRDRRADLDQAAYDEAYNRIEARLIAEEIADGAAEDYKPSGARVHELVVNELKQRKER